MFLLSVILNRCLHFIILIPESPKCTTFLYIQKSNAITDLNAPITMQIHL